jgi:hypothetical protein
MRFKFFIILLILLPVVQSCDESFNPYTDYKQNYGIACILRSDTTLQLVTVSKSYLSDETNASQPSLLFEKGADVRVWIGDSVYRFKDTVFVTGENEDSIGCYFNNSFVIKPNQNIELEVLLSNGKRMKAFSHTASDISFKNTSEVIIPPVGKNLVQIFWNSAGPYNYYLPQLKIKCEIIENGLRKIFYRELPKSLSVSNGITYPIYPSSNNSASAVYDMSAINWYLTKFADSLSNPSTVSIHQTLEFNLLIFDVEVSRYISVSRSSTNNLSIRFDEGEYTNIEGGLGIFGSQINKKYSRLKFLETFVRSKGFNFIYDL